MNDARLQPKKRRWLPNRRLLWAIGGIAAVGLCILVVLLHFAYWHGRMEQEIVADLLSKSPGGAAHVDNRPGWLNRLYELLGIPKPVTELFLKGNRINNTDLARLQSLRNLELLAIDQCPITDDGVREIVKLPKLEFLSLFFCNDITDTSITYLGAMKSLTSLNISTDSNRISGCNIRCLSALPNLGTLAVVDCPGISDDAVEPLTSLKQLVNLDIRGTSISEEGANRLGRALPDTIVLTDY